jgi:hypothetical protein
MGLVGGLGGRCGNTCLSEILGDVFCGGSENRVSASEISSLSGIFDWTSNSLEAAALNCFCKKWRNLERCRMSDTVRIRGGSIGERPLRP